MVSVKLNLGPWLVMHTDINAFLCCNCINTFFFILTTVFLCGLGLVSTRMSPFQILLELRIVEMVM